MALVSPGIQVTVTDQSNYSPNQPGSVAYVLLATHENKTAPGGGIAAGTLEENAGKVYSITSQRDLITTFGTPHFDQTSSGAPVNAGEQNEYGLLSAYSLLGVSNQVFVQRANVDLDALTGTTIRPVGPVDDSTYWFDVASTEWGIYEWDAGSQTFSKITPTVATTSANTVPNSFGSIGDYLIVPGATTNPLFYKGYDNTWTQVGTTDWQAQIPAVTGSVSPINVSANANIVINTTSIAITAGSNATVVATAINSGSVDGVFARASAGQLIISVDSTASKFGNSTTTGSANISFSNASLSTSLGITAGEYFAPTTQFSSYFSQPEWLDIDDEPRPTGSIWIKTSAQGVGANYVVKQYSSSSDTWTTIPTALYYSNGEATYRFDPTGGGLNIPQGSMWVKYDLEGDGSVSHGIWYRKNTGATVITGSDTATTGSSTDAFTVQISQPGHSGYYNHVTQDDTAYTVDLSDVSGATGTAANFVEAIGLLNIPYVSAAVSNGTFSITHSAGGEIRFVEETSGTPLANLGIDTSATNVYASLRGTALLGTNWAPLGRLGYTVSTSTPYAEAVDGKLWYNNDPTRIDILINTGSTWKGYMNTSTDIRGYTLTNTNPNGVIVSTIAPTLQDDGTRLEFGDLWLDSSDLENYPKLYRWQTVNSVDQWVAIDNTDNLSQNGIIFADARWGTTANVDPALDTVESVVSLMQTDYVDLDAPDPALYPRGILLFNTRASGFNVKQWNSNYFTASAYPNESLPEHSGTWKSVSGYDDAGIVPKFGRNATRSVVVSALKSAIDSSTALREEQNQFNIIACPGYSELIPNMINLNSDRNNTAFVVGDAPMRLAATGTDIIAWATNTGEETTTNEHGLTTNSPYLGLFYPHGQTTDLSGNTIVVPASHAILRAMIKSDNQSYPWFAPAGARRGTIDNIDSIGYVDSASGAFISVGVGVGLRDVMYNNNINPLTVLPGIGLVNYGNKTTQGDSTALSRINVARLVNYVRLQLDKLGRPFIFEPNDTITRNQMKVTVESLLNDLVTKRGITDYLVVCDTTNNTPDRIARNELWVDVAIQPTKDVEFIYIPIRLTNAGQLQSNNTAVAANPGTGA